MQLGMIGMGRMGSGMVARLLDSGHDCIVYDRTETATLGPAQCGALVASSLEELVDLLRPPRAVWMMIQTEHVGEQVSRLSCLMDSGDILVDGGNSHFRDDCQRASLLKEAGIAYLDVGTSGGLHGRQRGYCLMIGGDSKAVQQLDPIFRSLAPGCEDTPTAQDRRETANTAEHGYLHCGPVGAGHFAKMVHNGIEYGMMAAYAEGLSVLRHARLALTTADQGMGDQDDLFDIPKMAELWRRGSMISSWLLDLTAQILAEDPDLSAYHSQVGDTGLGRALVETAIQESVPVHVLAAALFDRFSSRGGSDFGNQLLCAMRSRFGGHST